MPTFSPPLIEGNTMQAPGRHPLNRLMSFVGNWAQGATVRKDSTGTWHQEHTAYHGGATHATHNNWSGGVGPTSTITSPDEGLATAQEVYLGGHEYPVTEAKAAELRAQGFYVGGHWEAEEDKWTALVISNPEPVRSFIAGDATCSVNIPAAGVAFWSHADTLVGTISQGFRTDVALVKNSLVTRFSDGSLLQQVYSAAGPSPAPAWAHPNHPTVGFTPMDMVLDGSGESTTDVVVIGWAEPQTYDGSINDGVVMTMNGFGGPSAFSALNTGGGLFLPTSVHNDATYHYVLGRETNLQVMFPGGLIAGFPWAQDAQTNRTHLARVPLGSLPTQASWQFWTGSTWATGVANGTTAKSRLVDTKGAHISGISDITIHNGEFILATMPSTVNHVIHLYRSATVSGPYGLYAIVDDHPRSPDGGYDPPHGFGYWYGFPKFHEYLEPDAQTFLISHSQGLYPLLIGEALTQVHASQSTPTFVFAPKPDT